MTKNILVADDVKDVRELIKILLEREKFKVTLCEDNKQLLDSIKKNKYDLAIVDFHMPGLKIIDFFNELVQLKKELPIIVISGTQPQEMITKCSKANYKLLKGMIEKPFDNAYLVKTVKEALKSY